jgi:hypothetical protein
MIQRPIGGIASADKLVSPRYFEDAMLVTPFYAPDANFDHDVESVMDFCLQFLYVLLILVILSLA